MNMFVDASGGFEESRDNGKTNIKNIAWTDIDFFLKGVPFSQMAIMYFASILVLRSVI